MIKKYSFLLTLLTIDVFFIIAHLIWGQYRLFNLDLESNLPTIWQGGKEIVFGTISCLMCITYIFKCADVTEAWFWGFLGEMFTYLGLDELAQIHENLPDELKQIFPMLFNGDDSSIHSLHYQGTSWIVYYLPVFAFSIPIFIFLLYRMYVKLGWHIIFGIFGILFLCMVPVAEGYNTAPGLDLFWYTFWVCVEEGSEMFGVTFMFFSAYLVIRESELSIQLHQNQNYENT